MRVRNRLYGEKDYNGVWIDAPDVYYSERFRKRKKGDVFTCLRCGKKVRIREEDCDWIAVPYRKREKIVEYLRQVKCRA